MYIINLMAKHFNLDLKENDFVQDLRNEQGDHQIQMARIYTIYNWRWVIWVIMINIRLPVNKWAMDSVVILFRYGLLKLWSAR